MWSNKSRLAAAAAFAMVVALAGCVEPEPPVPVKPLSPALKQELMNVGLAVETVRNCRGGLGLNTAQLEKLKPRLEAEVLGEGGEIPSKRTIDAILKKSLSEKEVQDQVFGYIQKRDIVISESQTWCVAGAKEIAAKTPLGKYLTLRK